MYLLKKSLHTEKSLSLNSLGKYVFVVNINANKSEIKKNISRRYKVTVTSVCTCICKEKKTKRYTRTKVIQGKHPKYKKAIVTLKEGDMIDVYAENI